MAHEKGKNVLFPMHRYLDEPMGRIFNTTVVKIYRCIAGTQEIKQWSTG